MLTMQNTERQGALYRFALVVFVCILVLHGTYFRHRTAVAVPTVDWFVLARLAICCIAFMTGILLIPKNIHWGFGAKALLCYVLAAGVSALKTPYLTLAFGYIILLSGAGMLMLALVYRARDIAQLEKIETVWILTVTALVLKDAGTAIFMAPPSSVSGGRLGMGVTHATQLSLFAALLFWFSFGTRRSRHRILWWVWRIFLLYVLIAAKSRISLVGFVAAGCCYFFFCTRDYLRRGIVISAISLVAFTCLFAFSLGQGWAGGMSDYMKRGQDTKELASFTGRSFIWKHTARKAQETPIAGHGFGVSRLTMGKVPGMIWEPPHCHNEALEVFFSTGLLGLVPFVAMVLYNTKWVWDPVGLEHAFSRTLALHAMCLVLMLLISFMFEVRLSGPLSPIQPLYFFYLMTLDRKRYFRRLSAQRCAPENPEEI